MAGIHDHTVIDALAEHPEHGHALVILDDLPWTDKDAKLADLSAKLATYEEFVLDGQYYEVAPEAEGSGVSIVLQSTTQPPAEAFDAVARTERIINEALRERPSRAQVELATRLLESTVQKLKPADEGFAAFVVSVDADGAENRTTFVAETFEAGVRDAWTHVETLEHSAITAIVFDGYLKVAGERTSTAIAFVGVTGADRSFRFALSYGVQRGILKRVVARGPVQLLSTDEPLVRP
jgi:hypothetical protein